MPNILAIDPGPEQSAWVLWNGAHVCGHGKEPNDVMLRHFACERFDYPTHVIFEQVASYGMAVGAEVFETVFWTGRFYEQALAYCTVAFVDRLPRRAVKLHLCGQSRAKDSNIRQALIDRFGGKELAIGKKAAKGPLYGLKADTWQALALAITWLDQHNAIALLGSVTPSLHEGP